MVFTVVPEAMGGVAFGALDGSKRYRVQPCAGEDCLVPLLQPPTVWLAPSLVTTTKAGVLVVHCDPFRISNPRGGSAIPSAFLTTIPALALGAGVLVLVISTPWF